VGGWEAWVGNLGLDRVGVRKPG